MSLEIRFQYGPYQFHFFDRFDEKSRRFEDDLRGGRMLVDTIPWPKITFTQSYRHLESDSKRFFVLQMLRVDSGKAYQIAVVENVSRIPFFRQGRVSCWIPSLEPDSLRDEAVLIKVLRDLCRKHTSLISLRIHSYIPGDCALDAAEMILREAGFVECELKAPAKTRFVDLRPPLTEILAQFSSKSRPKLKIKKPEMFSVGEITSRDAIPALKDALSDAFRRTAVDDIRHDFDSFFNIIEKFPESIVALGFFLAEEPGIPQAFVAGVASPPLFAYSLAGSRTNAQLRQYPFNIILLWRLMEAAKARGAEIFDLGGITDGGPGDPLAGISNFKRHFPGFESSIGREYQCDLRPVLSVMISVINKSRLCRQKLSALARLL